MKRVVAAAGLVVFGLVGSGGLAAADWPRLGGPAGTGCSEEMLDAARIGAASIRWRAHVGAGGSAPVTQGQRIYVLGCFKPGLAPSAESTPLLNDFPTHWKNKDEPSSRKAFDVYVTCVEQADGSILWQTMVSAGEFLNQQAGCQAQAAIQGEVVAIRTPGVVAVVRASDGTTSWTRTLVAEGVAQSPFAGAQGGAAFLEGRTPPLIHDGLVVVSFIARGDGGDSSAVMAFDARTGETAWSWKATPFNGKTWHPERNSTETGYPSHGPALNLATFDGHTTLVVSTGHATIGLDPRTGNRKWTFNQAEGIPQIAAFVNNQDRSAPNPWKWWQRYGYPPPAPMIADSIVVDRIFCGHGTFGSGTYAINISGDKPEFLWFTSDLSSRWARFAIKDDRLYGMDLWGHNPHTIEKGRIDEWPRPRRADEVGQFQCRDLKSGKLLWSSDALYQTLGRESHRCEKVLGGPCPALSDRDRDLPNEGGYSYEGESMYVLCRNTLVFRGFTKSLPGLFFADISMDRLDVIGHVEVDLGPIGFGEPVVSGGDCLVRAFDESGGPGNLICVSLH